jgi:hypothetical protein
MAAQNLSNLISFYLFLLQLYLDCVELIYDRKLTTHIWKPEQPREIVEKLA